MAPDSKLAELLATIDAEGIDVPTEELIRDVQHRIEQADRALAECKAVLISTEDPTFQPVGWRLNVTDAVLDTSEQRKRLKAYLAELQAQGVAETPAAEEDLILEEG